MTEIFWLYITGGVLLAGLSIPLILRRVPPNGLYGFRVKATLENPALWYDVNAYAGRGLLATALCTLLATLILRQLDLSIDTYALACLAAMFIPLAITLFFSVGYLRRREKQLAGQPPPSRI